jgi:hypothetical protein
MTTKKHDDHDEHELEHEGKHDAKAQAKRDAEIKAAPKAAEPLEQPFPFTASINEPQTVSLPLPADVVVPKPSIASLNPDTCAIGDPDFPLVISGENFFADSVIHFAAHDEPTTFDADAKTLSTGIKPSLWADPVTVQVQVKNGPEISDPVDFEFTAVASRSKRGR